MTPVRPRFRSHRAGPLVAAAALCFYLATAGGSLASSDAVMTFEVTKSLVLHGSVAASYDVKGMDQHRGVDGRFYSPFGIGQSLFNIPFYLIGRATGRLIGGRISGDPLDKAAVALGSTFAAAGIVWVTFLFAEGLSGNIAAATRTALAVGFGTLIWPYSKFGFNAPLTALCLLGGVYAAWIGVKQQQPRAFVWSGIWLSCAFLTRHEMALAVPVIAIWVASQLRENPRRAVTALAYIAAPLAAAAVFWLWYNFVRFGNPLNSGYLGDPTINFYGPLQGVYGLLFSPGRSIFVYAPLTIVGVAALAGLTRRDPSLAALFGALTLTLLLFYSTLSSWEGGRSYGPRYLVPVLPFLTIPTVWWLRPGGRHTRTALAAIVVSVLVQVPGVLVDFSKVSVAYARTGGNVPERRLYSWSESGLVLNARAALAAVPANVGFLARGRRPIASTFADDDNARRPDQRQPPAPDTESQLNRELGFSLDFWWLYLFYLGAIPAALSAVIPIVLIAAGCAALRSVPPTGEDFG